MRTSFGLGLGITMQGVVAAISNFLASAEDLGNLILTTDGQNIILSGAQ